MKTLRFYFDPISPYAYLAFTQLPTILKDHPCELISEPVLLAALLNHHGQKGPAEIPEKRAYTIRDMLRWAKVYGVPLEGPPAHPFNPLLPLRVAIAIDDPAARNRFSGALLHATWGKGHDVTDPEVLAAIAVGVGLDGKALLLRAQTPEVKEALKENAVKAISQGVFGVPTFQVDDQLFWGNDRLPFLKNYLALKDPLDPEQVKKILARPRTASRT